MHAVDWLGEDGASHRDGGPDWLPTLFTLQLLRATEVDRAEPAVERAVARLEAGFRWDAEFGARPFFEGEGEAVGAPSRWITLRALRVPGWAES
jgi:hypothetical protein